VIFGESPQSRRLCAWTISTARSCSARRPRTPAKLAFANAIVIAQRAGETDDEIARVTGYTVPMIRAVLTAA
jgi:hypothetical protein